MIEARRLQSIHMLLQCRLLIFLVAWWAPVSDSMCPAGFGVENAFPEEWKIPKWPQDMPIQEAAQLGTITLGGFKIKDLNEEYLEGPGEAFHMQGRETYWQSSGKYFMYFCERFRKWRIAEISGFSDNMNGNCFAFSSDAYPDRDVRNSSLVKGWIEVENGQWQLREKAGVVEVGKLGDQMDIEQETDEQAETAECSNDTDAEESPFGEKKSNCPVMPVVRKARDKVVKMAGKWMKRLFPKQLGAPDEEDAIPEDTENPLFEGGELPEDDACDPDTQQGCSFKQKFYIEKMVNQTVNQQKDELKRLWGMRGVVMKDDQKKWLMARVALLNKMVKAVDKTFDKAEL